MAFLRVLRSNWAQQLSGFDVFAGPERDAGALVDRVNGTNRIGIIENDVARRSVRLEGLEDRLVGRALSFG